MDLRDHKHRKLSEDIFTGAVQPGQHLCTTRACVRDVDAEETQLAHKNAHLRWSHKGRDSRHGSESDCPCQHAGWDVSEDGTDGQWRRWASLACQQIAAAVIYPSSRWVLQITWSFRLPFAVNEGAAVYQVCNPHTVFWVYFIFVFFWFGALFVWLFLVSLVWILVFLLVGRVFFLVLMEKLFTPLQLALSTRESEQSFMYFAIPYAEPTNIWFKTNLTILIQTLTAAWQNKSSL